MATTRLTLADLMGTNQISADSLGPLLKALGITDYRETEGYSETDGSPIYRNTLTPEAMRAADGYSFGWDNYSTPGNTGQITAFDPSGKSAGTFDQRDKTGRETFMDWAKMAALAVPGLGAMGIGPMGGMLGGLGAGSEVAAGNGAFLGEAAWTPTADAWGSTVANSLDGFGLQNAGMFGDVAADTALGNGAFLGEAAWTPTAEAALGNGAFLGEGVASGIPAWDAAAGMAGAAPAAAGAALGNGAFIGEGVASGIPAWDAAAAAAGGAGLLGNIKSGIDALGGMKTIAPLLGAAAGAASSGSGAEATQQSKIDPRMEAMLYGSGGLLGQAQSYFNANKNPNADMVAGADMRRKFLTDPSYAQGYGQLKTQGLGLLGGGVAGNPYTNGQASLSPSTPMQFPRTRTMFGG